MSSKRVPYYKVNAASKRTNASASKKSKTFKDTSDSTLFTKDYKDFISKVNNSLNRPSDVKNIQSNLVNALKRLYKLKKKMKRYVKFVTGNYHTRKVPKLLFSEEGRPAYYKSSKFQNKGGTIPYDKKIYVKIRKVNLSIIDKITKKSIYKTSGVSMNQDTYNRFFKDLIDTSFKNIEIPMKELKDAFFRSSKSTFIGLEDTNSTGRNRILALLKRDTNLRDQESYDVISSTLKSLMFGGFNRTYDRINIEFFSSKGFYDLFTGTSVTAIFNRGEILTMLLNLSIAYSYYFYGRNKTKDDLEVIATIRANIVSINQLNRMYARDSEDDMEYEVVTSNRGADPPDGISTTDIYNIGTSNQSSMTDTEESTQVLPPNINQYGTSSYNRNVNPFSPNYYSQKSTISQVLPKNITTEVNPDAGIPNNDTSSPILLQVNTGVTNSIITPSNEQSKKSRKMNVIDLLASNRSNYPSGSNEIRSEQRSRKSKFPITEAGSSIQYPYTSTQDQGISPTGYSGNLQSFSNTPYNSNDTYDPATPLRSGTSKSLYKSDVGNSAQGNSEAATYIDKISNLFGYMFTIFYSMIQLITSDSFDRSKYQRLIDTLLKDSGLSKYRLPNIDQTSLTNALIGLENSLNSVMGESDNRHIVTKSNYDLNINNMGMFDQMVEGLKRSGDNNPDKNILLGQLRQMKDYLTKRSNMNNIGLRVSLSDISEETDDSDISAYNSNVANINSLNHMKEIVSIIKQFIPMDENTVLSSKMNQMES
jgi:hypothetical protein